MKENKEILKYRETVLQKIQNNEEIESFVFSVDDIEMGILELSVFLEDYVTVKKLLEYGIDPNGKKNLDDISPLMIATESKNNDIVDILIKYRADINQADELGITPLMIATRNNDLQNIKSLIIAGADIYKNDFYGQSSISMAGAGDDHDVFDFYTKVMLKNDNFKFHYDNILFSAISSKNMVFIKKFISNNDIKNIHNNQGKTPLHIAIESDYIEAIPLLLSNGVDINKADHTGALIYNLNYQCQYIDDRKQEKLKQLIERYVPLIDRIGAIKSTITTPSSSRSRKVH